MRPHATMFRWFQGRSARRRWPVFVALVCASLRPCALGGDARPSTLQLQLPLAEGAAHGFPVLRDATGRRMADGEFTQIPEGDHLRVTLRYDFGPGHRIVEHTVMRQRPALAQEEWSWEETRAGEIVRRYAVDFRTGRASVQKQQRDGRKQWEETLKIEPGRTFAGFAFTLAIECLRARLVGGEKIELRAVGFTPHPRLVMVEIAYGGRDEMAMGGRRVSGERFLIHPKIPAIARPFIAAPDTRIWLIHPAPNGFLRWEGTPVEPKDEIVRVDLLPGEVSGPATPENH